MSKNHWWALLCVALVFSGLSLSACGNDGAEVDDAEASETEATTKQDGEEKAESDEGEAEGEEEQAERRERAVSVTGCAARIGDLVIPVLAEGTIRSRRSSEIRFEIAGRLDRIHVSEGQRVRRGEPLATLDNREYKVAFEEASARYLDALGKLAVEEDNLRSDETAARELAQGLKELEELESNGTITRDERRAREIQLGIGAVKDGAYRRELLEVRSGLAAARADEQRAELSLERTLLRAPFDGVISGLTLGPGERVQVSALLCTLVDDIELEAEVGILESDLRMIVLGRGALLEIPALDQSFPAKVDVISPSVDVESRTCQVLLRIKSDGRVRPGMFVRASIAGEILHDRLVVPRESILTRDGRPLVFRVEGDRAKWQYVTLGQRNDHLVEVTGVLQGGALNAGDVVVVDNHLTLTHEAKITVRKTVEPDDPWLAIAGASLAAETH
jgi:RND family efflux transporter MFP subunit